MHETKYNKSRFTLAKLKKRSLDTVVINLGLVKSSFMGKY